MLYAQQDSLRVEVKIPRNLTMLPVGDYSFKLRNNANRSNISIGGLGDYSNDFNADFRVVSDCAVIDTAFFHRVMIDWPNTPTAGEYSYKLTKGNTIVASGLLMVVKGRKVDEYENEKIYEQFNS